MKALCIRKSTNTNSFGLRGVWVIAREPNDQKQHLVWSFGVNHLDEPRFKVGEFVDVQMFDGRPAHELNCLQAEVPVRDVEEFLGLFSGTLYEAWRTA